MKPSERLLARRLKSNTATKLLSAFAIKSVFSSGESARLFRVGPLVSGGDVLYRQRSFGFQGGSGIGLQRNFKDVPANEVHARNTIAPKIRSKQGPALIIHGQARRNASFIDIPQSDFPVAGKIAILKEKRVNYLLPCPAAKEPAAIAGKCQPIKALSNVGVGNDLFR